MSKLDFEPLLLLQNNTPLDEFCGLTSTEMHRLLYNPFGDESPFKIQNNVDYNILDRIPFFRLSETFINILQREGNIKLTPKGALPKTILHELYSYKYIPEYMIEKGFSKLHREIDSVALSTLHCVMPMTGIIRKVNGNLKLTKKSEILTRTDQRMNLFREILITYIDKFNWGFNDRYPGEGVGQFGWGFTVYLLLKFGSTEQPVKFYADKYLKAFPSLIEAFPMKVFGPPEKVFVDCYRVRVFERFLRWFGLVSLPLSEGIHDSNDSVKSTDILKEIFQQISY